MNTRKVKKNSADILSDSLSAFFKRFANLPNIVYYLIPFLALSVWLCTLVLSNSISTPHTYYLLLFLFTYDHGYIARGLFGEILSWFVDVLSDEIILEVIICLDFLLIIAVSLCIGKVLSKTKKNLETFSFVCFLCVCSFFLPLSYGDFFIDEKLDKIVWLLALFAVFCTGNKHLIWFVPAICIIATLVNPVFLISSMLFVSIILLYKYFKSRFSLKNLFLCISSYIPMLILGVSGPIMHKRLGFETADEMVSYYFSRYDKPLNPDILQRFASDWIFDYFNTTEETLKRAFEIYFFENGGGPATISCFVFIAFPVFVFFTWFWIKTVKQTHNKFQKFIYLLCSLVPLVSIPVSLVSWEFQKYFAYTVIIELVLIQYFFTEGLSEVKITIYQCIVFVKNNIFFTAVVGTYVLAFL